MWLTVIKIIVIPSSQFIQFFAFGETGGDWRMWTQQISILLILVRYASPDVADPQGVELDLEAVGTVSGITRTGNESGWLLESNSSFSMTEMPSRDNRDISDNEITTGETHHLGFNDPRQATQLTINPDEQEGSKNVNITDLLASTNTWNASGVSSDSFGLISVNRSGTLNTNDSRYNTIDHTNQSTLALPDTGLLSTTTMNSISSPQFLSSTSAEDTHSTVYTSSIEIYSENQNVNTTHSAKAYEADRTEVASTTAGLHHSAVKRTPLPLQLENRTDYISIVPDVLQKNLTEEIEPTRVPQPVGSAGTDRVGLEIVVVVNMTKSEQNNTNSSYTQNGVPNSEFSRKQDVENNPENTTKYDGATVLDDRRIALEANTRSLSDSLNDSTELTSAGETDLSFRKIEKLWTSPLKDPPLSTDPTVAPTSSNTGWVILFSGGLSVILYLPVIVYLAHLLRRHYRLRS